MGLQIDDYSRVRLVANKRDPGAHHAVEVADCDFLSESGFERWIH